MGSSVRLSLGQCLLEAPSFKVFLSQREDGGLLTSWFSHSLHASGVPGTSHQDEGCGAGKIRCWDHPGQGHLEIPVAALWGHVAPTLQKGTGSVSFPGLTVSPTQASGQRPCRPNPAGSQGATEWAAAHPGQSRSPGQQGTAEGGPGGALGSDGGSSRGGTGHFRPGQSKLDYTARWLQAGWGQWGRGRRGTSASSRGSQGLEGRGWVLRSGSGPL